MTFPDIKTLLLVYISITLVCFFMMISLWLQNRRYYPEIFFWLIDYALQFIALILVSLRNVIPDALSIVLANSLIITGLVILYIGLERHIRIEKRNIHNYTMVIAFTGIHAYLTYIHPSLALRNVNLSTALFLISAQGALLMFKKTDPSLRRATRMTGIVLVAFCLVGMSHIIANLIMTVNNDIFRSGLFDALTFLEYQTLFVLLTFALFLMVSRRLLIKYELELNERIQAEEALLRSEEKFSTAFKTSPYGIVISRMSDGKFIEVNDAFVRVTGYSRDEINMKNSMDLKIWVNENDRNEVTAALATGESIFGREFLFKKKDGGIVTGLFSTQKIDISGEECILSSINDISDRKIMEDELHRQSRFMSELIEHSGTLICVKNRDGKYVLVNRKWEDVTGFSRDRILGRTDEELFPGDIGREFHRNDLEVLETGDAIEREEVLVNERGKQFFISIKFPLRDDNGAIYGLCGMITDITERKENEEKIKHLATHDILTDLPSLRLANDRMAMAMSIARRHKNKTAVMFIDLDGFKNVNDTLGHDAGDHVLKETAKRMTASVRNTDTVARVGGDEFLVISTEIHSPDDAARIAKTLIQSIAAPISIENNTAIIGASIGIAIYPDHGNEIKTLIKKADKAMYSVKYSGKNNFSFADASDEKTHL